MAQSARSPRDVSSRVGIGGIRETETTDVFKMISFRPGAAQRRRA